MSKLQELRQKRAGLIEESRGILDADEFNEERYNELQAKIDSLAEQIERLEASRDACGELMEDVDHGQRIFISRIRASDTCENGSTPSGSET